ncbi:hypothetical protein K435DRAFT_858373 [Dendrothele bispora CBS 962.96]|uniref:Uncharacterized protein n=1 Tax=Dendrothele bispora (strain CBS 962.96) TaxID=1314807 RepID=A0A4S8M3T7_DENBC|nr:hypothetical protein K435DRAFT_858373 [Dendrothele bispora CBS 962.96]
MNTGTRSKKKPPPSQTPAASTSNVPDADIASQATPTNPKSPPEHTETVSPQHKHAYSHLIESEPVATTPTSKSVPSRVSPLSSPDSGSHSSSSSSDNSCHESCL